MVRTSNTPAIIGNRGSSNTEINTSLQNSGVASVAVDTDPGRSTLLATSASGLRSRDNECTRDGLVCRLQRKKSNVRRKPNQFDGNSSTYSASDQYSTSPVLAVLNVRGVSYSGSLRVGDEVHGLALAGDLRTTGSARCHALFPRRDGKYSGGEENLDEEGGREHCTEEVGPSTVEALANFKRFTVAFIP